MKKLLSIFCLSSFIWAQSVLIFGDSNTFGVAEFGTHPDNKIFANIVGDELSKSAKVQVNGLPGRTIGLDYPREQFNGARALKEALSASKYDALIIMLGTNDLIIGADVKDALSAFSSLLDIAARSGITRFIIIAPPLLDHSDELKQKSLAFNAGLKDIASKRKASFIDAAKIIGKAHEADGVHMSLEDHAALAKALMPLARELK